ncbi:hypothetical protein F5880DRAFT_1512344 [Lentinula raphanica]|nr:hypothetical protein F5880DRAFT_1512344 [Lentinula raphanica]
MVNFGSFTDEVSNASSVFDYLPTYLSREERLSLGLPPVPTSRTFSVPEDGSLPSSSHSPTPSTSNSSHDSMPELEPIPESDAESDGMPGLVEVSDSEDGSVFGFDEDFDDLPDLQEVSDSDDDGDAELDPSDLFEPGSDSESDGMPGLVEASDESEWEDYAAFYSDHEDDSEDEGDDLPQWQPQSDSDEGEQDISDSVSRYEADFDESDLWLQCSDSETGVEGGDIDPDSEGSDENGGSDSGESLYTDQSYTSDGDYTPERRDYRFNDDFYVIPCRRPENLRRRAWLMQRQGEVLASAVADRLEQSQPFPGDPEQLEKYYHRFSAWISDNRQRIEIRDHLRQFQCDVNIGSALDNNFAPGSVWNEVCAGVSRTPPFVDMDYPRMGKVLENQSMRKLSQHVPYATDAPNDSGLGNYSVYRDPIDPSMYNPSFSGSPETS